MVQEPSRDAGPSAWGISFLSLIEYVFGHPRLNDFFDYRCHNFFRHLEVYLLPSSIGVGRESAELALFM